MNTLRSQLIHPSRITEIEDVSGGDFPHGLLNQLDQRRVLGDARDVGLRVLERIQLGRNELCGRSAQRHTFGGFSVFAAER